MNIDDLKWFADFKKEISDNVNLIDPNDEHLWNSLALGWLIGKGCPIDTANGIYFYWNEFMS